MLIAAWLRTPREGALLCSAPPAAYVQVVLPLFLVLAVDPLVSIGEGVNGASDAVPCTVTYRVQYPSVLSQML